jgi:hypothetical protein
MSNIIWSASFDIGKKNFAFYIEEYNIEDINNQKNITKNKRYNKDGTTTKEFSKVIKNICLNGKTIIFKNSDLTIGCDKKKYLDKQIYYNMYDLLDNYKEYWDKCSYFVIEQQMSFGNRRNTMALKLGQHCYSYFVYRYGRFGKDIFEFPAYHKTQVLGAQKIQKKLKSGKISYKAIDKPARKKWSIIKATEILENRNELEIMNQLKSKKKKDDLADVLCQLQAFKFLYFIDKTIS